MACLGVTALDWERLGVAALEELSFEIARKAFQRRENIVFLTLIDHLQVICTFFFIIILLCHIVFNTYLLITLTFLLFYIKQESFKCNVSTERVWGLLLNLFLTSFYPWLRSF